MITKVVVLGCGVSGLSCGIRLLEQGFEVTILARELPPQTTSNKAAAIWFPYKVQPEQRVLKWGQHSLDEFYRLAEFQESGVSLIKLVELFDRPAPNPWWKTAVRRFDRLATDELPPGYQAGFTVEVPLIETPLYLPYLMSRFEGLGGLIQQRTITSLAQLEPETRLIINCTGLGAGQLAGDPHVYPIRGQIMQVQAPAVPHCFMAETDPQAPLYIIPRRNDCILGGTAQEHDDSIEVDPATARRILTACQQLTSSLYESKILEHLVGLRPGRTEVRLEVEPVSERCTVIHNYGHGGAGFTLSWGCAQEVIELALQQKG